MTTTTAPTIPLLTRLLAEGYGPGAWHGPDMKAALAEVSPGLAFWRPGPGRHSIAEIALHHAFYVRSVIGRLTGTEPPPFVLEGEDWFAVPDLGGLDWAAIRTALEERQQALVAVAADIDAGRVRSPLPESARFDLALGITCHAVYHAGQVQLIKALAGPMSGGVR